MEQLPKPKLSSFNMASIFKYYVDDDGFEFFNILKRINLNVDNFDDKEIFSSYVFTASDTITYVSYKFYGTVELWWLICILNGIKNPFKRLDVGTQIHLLRPSYAARVVEQINNAYAG